jgi:tetratricopeptide (TPR) repeat protein
MQRLFWSFIVLCAFPLFLQGQNARLAQQYYNTGEYEKASVMYNQLFEQFPNQDFYFNRYIECLLALEEYKDAEKSIRQQLRKNENNIQFYVTLGNLYERQARLEDAEKEYQKAIDKLRPDRSSIIRLAQTFQQLTKYDEAIATYEKGTKLLKDDRSFAYYLGDLYRRKGDTPNMVKYYLNSLDENPSRITTLESIFQRYLTDEDFDLLQMELYTRIQEDRQATYYVELLAWVFIHRKDYRNALRQVKALDKRLKEPGGRVFQLARTAYNDKDYTTAISGYEYVVDEKGPNSPYYIEAKRQLLRTRREQIVEDFNYLPEDLVALEQEYEAFLTEFGRTAATARIQMEMAELEALYLNNIDKAIQILMRTVAIPGLNKNTQGEAKLSLADYYLIQGERWESTLLYSQVDKTFEEDPLGHEARFRNAKLSYYFGDFEWAQAQFDILKASTSKLIANDALDLSVFIMDNLGLDTTEASLMLYAEADLLAFQNRFDEAYAKLDTLLDAFPEHALQDDVLYAKAQMLQKQRDYVGAADLLEKIIEKHPEEIRADNALFQLAELNEIHLGNSDRARDLYEKLFLEYSGSTFSVQARKRFRRLRGDDI